MLGYTEIELRYKIFILFCLMIFGNFLVILYTHYLQQSNTLLIDTPCSDYSCSKIACPEGCACNADKSCFTF